MGWKDLLARARAELPGVPCDRTGLDHGQMAAPRAPICNRQKPWGQAWRCTRQPGHLGEHVAFGLRSVVRTCWTEEVW